VYFLGSLKTGFIKGQTKNGQKELNMFNLIQLSKANLGKANEKTKLFNNQRMTNYRGKNRP